MLALIAASRAVECGEQKWRAFQVCAVCVRCVEFTRCLERKRGRWFELIELKDNE